MSSLSTGLTGGGRPEDKSWTGLHDSAAAAARAGAIRPLPYPPPPGGAIYPPGAAVYLPPPPPPGAAAAAPPAAVVGAASASDDEVEILEAEDVEAEEAELLVEDFDGQCCRTYPFNHSKILRLVFKISLRHLRLFFFIFWSIWSVIIGVLDLFLICLTYPSINRKSIYIAT